MTKGGRIGVLIGLPVVILLGVLSYFLWSSLGDASGSAAVTDAVATGTKSEPQATAAVNGDRTSAIYPADLLTGSNEARNVIEDLPTLLSASQLDAISAAPPDAVVITAFEGMSDSGQNRVFIYDVPQPDTASLMVTASGFQPEALVPFGAVYVQALPGGDDVRSPTQASSFHIRADGDGAVAFVIDVSHLGLYQVTTGLRDDTDLSQFFVVTSADDDVAARAEWLDTQHSS